MRFDPRSAKLLKPGEHLLVDGCPGLRLNCNATRKTWTYRYELDGRMKQKAIGHWPEMPLHVAVGEWEKLRTTDRKRNIKAPADYTVKQLLDDFTVGHLKASRTPDSYKAAVRILDKASEIWDTPASAVTRAVAFDLLDKYKDIPMAATKLRSLLASAWDYALDAGRIHEDTPNRWRDVMKGRLKSKGKTICGVNVGTQRRALSTEEVGELIKWLPNMNAVSRDATIMYLWTCARGGEILSMQPDHIAEEKDGWWWTIPKSMTKNAKVEDAVDLRVPLFGRSLEVVQRRMAQTPMFENSDGEPYTQRAFGTYVYGLQPYSKRHATLRCPVTDWTPHNLRRTSRTLLAALGCPNEIGEAILGHLPAELVATYNVHTYDKERKEWLKLLSDHLDQLSS